MDSSKVLLLLTNSHIKQLFSAFKKAGYEIRYVGGCVRDALVGYKVQDIDFATTSIPTETQRILKENNIYYYNSGLKHGTISAVFNKISYEITSLRHDLECDGRYAIVEYTNNWQCDAARRDFTFNALYMDEKGKIYDYFNGIEDLKNGRLIFIGDAQSRITEDYLRILRALRFYDRYGQIDIDQDTKNILYKNASYLEKLSGERIQQEIIRLFKDIKNIRTLELMNELDLSFYVFYKTKLNFFYLNNLFEFEINDPWLRLGIILRYNQIAPTLIYKNWHLSNVHYTLLKEIFNLQINKDFLDYLNKYFFLYFKIKDICLICAYLENIINKDQLKNLFQEWNKKEPLKLPINNQDLINLGFKGKEIGVNIRKAMEIWLENNCLLGKEYIIKLLK